MSLVGRYTARPQGGARGPSCHDELRMELNRLVQDFADEVLRRDYSARSVSAARRLNHLKL
jgi:hypothetical protein